jgi:3-methyladenine DNA glycosylase AlkC
MKVTEIAPARLEQLNSGLAETGYLSECLAVDFAALLRAVLPDIDDAEDAEIKTLQGEGISRRMTSMGSLLARHLDEDDMTPLQSHTSDTVRGWACFALATKSNADLPAVLQALRPLADDPHFGVREWAWLAARPMIARDLPAAISLLASWTAEPSERVRRFASEATRPRGVWSAHIKPLKEEPGLGLPILEPLRADPARYVQDSVGNWLNDAAKSRPDWVRLLCARWTAEAGGPETARIVKRATRSLTVVAEQEPEG